MNVRSMTEGKPIRLILSVALPLMVGNIFQQLYTVVDAQVVGSVEGVSALAALGAAEDFDEVGARLVEDNAGRRMWEFAVEVDVGDTHISGGAFVDAYTGEIVLFDYASGGNG